MSINEEWRWVPGYEGLYMVSDQGRVVSVPKGGKPGKELKQSSDGRYLHVTLYKRCESKTMLVHRIVASAFIDNPNLKEQVNHRDGNKKNNAVPNLEWCSSSENQVHKYRVLGVSHSVKSRRRFTDDQIHSIRSSNKGIRPLAREFGVSPTTIRQIKNRKSYKEVC